MNSTTATATIGVAGIGVMGRNLALNIESRGFTTALWNLTFDETDQLISTNPEHRFIGAKTPKEFIAAIKRPRAIILMITAGAPVDQTIERFLPLLDEGDILIDGGNTWYEDTARREARCKERGVHFVGMGVSGGEEGARLGPSLMPGGSDYAYQQIAPVLEKIAARTDDGPCVTHVGQSGAGHFVKMVHNGIEYADMQLIAEAYDLQKRLMNKTTKQIARTFDEWNKGPLSSFLVELTGHILKVPDPETGAPLVEQILDKAGQKGTGQWTIQAALSLGVPVPTIAAAVDARLLSAMKSDRLMAAENLDIPAGDQTTISALSTHVIHNALLAAKVVAYAQGLALIEKASQSFEWGVKQSECARIWKGGCIIRAKLLSQIMSATADNKGTHLLLDPTLGELVQQERPALASLVQSAAAAHIPVPAFAAALNYINAYTTARLPQNLIQAQRDAFGAHTYQRLDDPDGPFVHTNWSYKDIEN